jgi:hypothetical protein
MAERELGGGEPLSALPSVVILGLAMLAAAGLARARSPVPDRGVRVRAATALVVAVLIQAIHIAEEARTGFHEQLPALLGMPAMPFRGFIAFNLTWLLIWCVSVPGLRAARPLAYFAAWFLAIAGVLNGVGHHAFAIAVGGYFPGLFTSPLIAFAAAWLAVRLFAASERPAAG